MDSFSSYHINKGGNIHSFKIESHRTTCLQNSSRKMTEREDTTWSSSSSICILITCRWILGKRVISEVISRPFLVELFVAIAVFAFYQFWLPITFSGVCWFFFLQLFDWSIWGEVHSLLSFLLFCFPLSSQGSLPAWHWGNSLCSHCLSCSSAGPSNVPPSEIQSGSTCLKLPSLYSLFHSLRSLHLPVSIAALLRTAWRNDDLHFSNSNSKETRSGEISELAEAS